MAFLGVWLNNKSEDKRRRKQRDHDLIRETYFGAVEYVAYCIKVMASAGGDQFQELIESKELNTKNYYFLNLVATYDVMACFLKLSDKATEIIGKISLMHFEIVIINAEVKSELETRKIYQEQMDQILRDHKELISQETFSQEDSNSLLDRYQETMEKFNSTFDNALLLNKSLFERKISILKYTRQSMKETNPLIYEVLFLMRRDLDRKLSKKDLEKMKMILDKSLSNSAEGIENMIVELENLANREFQIEGVR